jgi:hypothetical protein
VHHARVAGPVEHHGRRGAPVRGERPEVVLGPAQVAEPLLAHGGHEVHRAAQPHPVAVERLREREQRRQPAPVVADAGGREPLGAVGRAAAAHGHGHRAGEHRVEVRAHGHRRLPGVAGPGAPSDDVPRAVQPHVGEAERRQPRGHPRRALALLAGGGGDLGELGLRAERRALRPPPAARARRPAPRAPRRRA